MKNILNTRLVELNALVDQALVEFENHESKSKRGKTAAVAGAAGLAGGVAIGANKDKLIDAAKELKKKVKGSKATAWGKAHMPDLSGVRFPKK